MAHAGAGGRAVFRTRGVQSDASIPFASLQQLLHPLLGRIPICRGLERRALEAAFGMGERSAPEIFLIGLATLELMSEASDDSPVVLAADDAHWPRPARPQQCWPSSLAALALEAASPYWPRPCDGIAGPFDDAGGCRACASLLLRPSTPLAALDHDAPGIGAPHRGRILEAGAGGPARTRRSRRSRSPTTTSSRCPDPPQPQPDRRLERSFAARAAGLRCYAAAVILVAALDDLAFPADILSRPGADTRRASCSTRSRRRSRPGSSRTRSRSCVFR